MEVLEEMREEIEEATGPEREELERSLDFCMAMMYLIEEGFITVEETEDGEDFLLYAESEGFDAPPIEA